VEVVREEELELGLRATRRCQGEGMILSTALPNLEYRWSTGDTTRQTIIIEPGNYSLTVSTGCASFEEDILIEAIPPLPTVDLGPGREIRIGDPLVLQPEVNAQQPVRYQWSAGRDSLLNCSDCHTLTVSPFSNTTYYVTITDGAGCTTSDSVHVDVLPAESIYFPNAFSPDGDGINDVFYMQGVFGAAAIRALRVFDRWGNLVFERQNGSINDEQYGWDGSAGGRTAATGVYIWIAELEFPDGSRRSFSGDLLLLRR
jgi:gliding motility-associated-like protein